jgi:enoyl-CoA hydratase/carnithine racemase
MFTTGIDGEPGMIALAALDDATLDATIDGFQQTFAWWRDDRIVSIAAVQGHAVGAGFSSRWPATCGCWATTRSCR